RRSALFGLEDAGRWAIIRRGERATQTAGASPDAIEQVTWVLLRRYGVVFWRMLEREAQWLPPWRELLRSLRRLEARGEIRGGRFVAGFSGEQYALPEAIGALREARRKPLDGVLSVVCGADPLNLVGIVTPGARVAALSANRVAYRDGLPIAALVAGEVRFLEKLEIAEQRAAENTLIRRPPLSPLLAFLR